MFKQFKLKPFSTLERWKVFNKEILINYKTPLETIALPMNADHMRKIIVANAMSMKNIGASNKETIKMFENILGPINGVWDLKRPFRVWKENGKWKTQGVSTCGLVARGIWRRVGVNMPEIYKNYNFGMAMIEEQKFCRAVKPRSAWHTPKYNDGIFPLPGDYIIIGSGLGTHNLTCIGWDGDTLISIDGGRVDSRGLQIIEKVKRDCFVKNGFPYLKDNRSTRRIIGWGMIDLLPYNNTSVAPEGWDDIEL